MPQAISELSWNPAGPDYSGLGNFFDLNGSTKLQRPLTNIGAAQFGGIHEEIVQLDTCTLPVSYRLNYTDDLFQAVGLVCETQSNIAETVHIDEDPPEAENLSMLSFNRATNELVAWWVGNALGADSMSFFTRDGFNSGLPIVRSLTDGAVDIHNGPSSPYSYPFDLSRIDATDSVRVVGALAKDKCDWDAVEDIVYHKSMDVDVEWKICDSTNIVSWTEYVGLNPDFAVEYQVFYSTNGGVKWDSVLVPTTDSTIDHLITQGGLTYSYYVRATSLDPSTPAWATPESNVASTLSIYEDTPLYYYLTNATVLPSNDVEVEYYRDIITPVKGYTVFRGENPDEMLPKAYFDAKDLGVEDRFTFIDETADVNANEYYYQVVSQNECDILTSRSNFGRTIHLVVESDDEGLTNTLKWNRYLDWDSTVAYYNVYRTSRDIYSTTIYKQVEPNSAYDYNVFVDDIADEVQSTGKFYYRVEAVQGSLKETAINGYPIPADLEKKVSNSNIAEALQDPLMYVPNAFAPDGINKRFGPKGQFYKFDQFEMTIYNRWGEQLYITTDINKGWDGTVDSKDASIGSYVYMIRYVDGDGKEKRKKGSFTLIR